MSRDEAGQDACRFRRRSKIPLVAKPRAMATETRDFFPVVKCAVRFIMCLFRALKTDFNNVNSANETHQMGGQNADRRAKYRWLKHPTIFDRAARRRQEKQTDMPERPCVRAYAPPRITSKSNKV